MAKRRMTTRRWLIAVAVSAALLEGYRELRLSWQYRQTAQMHARQQGPQQVNVGGGFFAFSMPSAENTAYHAAMRKKYDRAASRPWLPVAPDPPEPK